MKIFLTGATGYIGSAIAEVLQAAGHSVAGLARNDTAEQTLKNRGITPISADLHSPHSLIAAEEVCDGVISAGTTNDGHADMEAVHGMLRGLKGTNKPFIYTSGVWVLGNTGDTPATEDAPLNPPPIVSWRPSMEKEVLVCAAEGVRTIVIRPAMVYGRGGGLVGLFVNSALDQGAAYYIGDGENRWSMVNIEDLADLYLRAIEHAEPGTLLHGADGTAFKVRDIADAASFGAGAGGKTASWSVDEASVMFGPGLVEGLLLDQVVSGEKAKSLLAWQPHGISVLDDLRYGSYAMARINP